jgi:hypothetical protein
MRTTQDAAHRRRPAAGHALAGLSLSALIVMAALAGCSSGGASSVSSPGQAGQAGLATAVASPSAASGAFAAGAPAAGTANGTTGNGTTSNGTTSNGTGSAGGSGQAASAARLTPADQQIVYTAELTVRASNVSAAVSRATSIAIGAGGYISAENASNDPSDPHRATATISVKIPVAVYASTLSQLSADLGTQTSLQQQAQDVTEQVADVSSMVASDEAAIAQLRALLKHAGSVADLLTVQEQINSEESDLESLQAQQTALNHETTYATVTVTILGPQAKAVVKHTKPKAAPGFANGLSGGWRAFRTAVSWLLAIIGAAAPFAAVAAVLGYLAYWIRRRLAHRTQTPADG